MPGGSSPRRSASRRQRNARRLALRGGVGEIRLRSGAFIETPGIVADATRVLAHKGINLLEAVTSLSDIHFFVRWDDLDAAYDGLLKLVKTKY